MARFVITIDGPAASGKSTAARLLAERLGASFLDTGAMYRAATLAAIQAGIDLTDEKKLLGVLDNSNFEFKLEPNKTSVRINGFDVTNKIRSPQVTANARHIASTANVRQKLVQIQRQIAAGQEKIITEGRDQGTVAFPEADVKFYLTAETTERAKRRKAELPAQGQNLEQIRWAIEQRDKSDQSRGIGPLRPADDAIVVDTTDLNTEQVVEKLLGFIKEKCS